MVGPRPVTQDRLLHFLATSKQCGHTLRNSMKSLEPKALVVVGTQPLEIQQQLLLHLLLLKQEGVIAFFAPNRKIRAHRSAH